MSMITVLSWDGPDAFHSTIVDDVKKATSLLASQIPAVFEGAAAMHALHNRHKAVLALRITRHRLKAASCELKFRAHFHDPKIKAFWSAAISIKIALRGDLKQEIGKTTVSGRPEGLSQIERQEHLALLDTSLDAFFSKLDQAADLLPPGRISTENAKKLRRLMPSEIEKLLDQKDKALEEKKDARDARQAMLNALPNGTPLKIRRSSFERKWQLGVKRGNIPKAQAPNICLLHSNDFMTDELRHSTISTHQLLPLMGAAKIAEAQADPILFDFHHAFGKPVYQLPLDEQKPLHQSVRETEDLKARRRKAPKIWMQTGFSNTTFGYQVHLNGKSQSFSPVRSNERFPHPSYGRDACASVTSIHANERTTQEPLSSFCTPAGLLIVSKEIADLLRTHELGASTLEPITIYQKDGQPLSGDWYHLVIREKIAAVRVQQCHPKMMTSLRSRAIKPYEIHVDPKAPGALDLWFDPQVTPQGMFLSGRLHSALKKAGGLPALTFKPCDTL